MKKREELIDKLQETLERWAKTETDMHNKAELRRNTRDINAEYYDGRSEQLFTCIGEIFLLISDELADNSGMLNDRLRRKMIRSLAKLNKQGE